MRILKLVVWDLDETLLSGILEEGDGDVNPDAEAQTRRLEERGILQALATQNLPDLVPPALDRLGLSRVFVRTEADLGPKADKVRRILEALEVDPLDAAFVDEDPFERDALSVLIPTITTWSVAELEAYLGEPHPATTREALRRPDMYRAEQERAGAETTAEDYAEFLRSCRIRIAVRPCTPEDEDRAAELLTRTHRMNLGLLPVAEAVACFRQPGAHRVLVAELADIYGDMGRCGIVHLNPDGPGTARIESLAISCRTRARGLSLAMLCGMLRHPAAGFPEYRCRYRFNGSNRPLRMLLLGAGFKPRPDSDELLLTRERLAALELPDWVRVHYGPAPTQSGLT